MEKLVNQNLTVNRAAVTMLTNADILSKKKLEEVAIRVIRGYKEKYKDELKSGATKGEAMEEAVNGKRQMVARVQNAVVFQISKAIRSEYEGEFYVWLPSDADEPDPLHQLNYGSKFQIGKGEMPGERYGCRCGMNILVRETRLKLGSE